MEIHVASAGHCFGIERAYRMINELAADGRPLYGALQKKSEWDTFRRVENRDWDLLTAYPHLGNLIILHEPVDLRDGNALAVGHHGLDPERRQELEERGIKIHDYICPFIARMNKIAEQLANEGYDIIVFGKPQNHHTEYAKQAAERAGQVALIAETLAEVELALQDAARTWACIGQVTGNAAKWQAFSEALKARDVPIHVVDTVCTDSHDRQREAMDLARKANVVVVVDDGGGASVSVLEACSSVNRRVHRYGTEMPLRAEWFEGATSVAVVGGILVPRWTLDTVAMAIRELARAK